MDKKVCDVLNKKVPVYQRAAGGNKSYPYLKGEDVISRANEAFDHSWSSEVISVEEKHDFILVHVRVSAHDVTLQREFHHDGFGSAKIARTTTDNKIVDLGNNYKSAYTIALKKALEQFGIGLGEDSDESDNDAPAKPAQSYSQNKPSYQQSSKPSTPPTQTSKPVVSTSVPAPSTQNKVPNLPASVSNVDTGAKINMIQIGAIKNLSRIRNIGKDEEEVLQKILPGTTKKSIEELTNSEAVSAIKALNNYQTNMK